MQSKISDKEYAQRKEKNMGERIRLCFAVCAYKNSPYLENCIQSLKRQTLQSDIILATSTPSQYIEELAAKYELPYFVRKGKSDIQDDWSFAYRMAYRHTGADYVTIAHQDDEYAPEYARMLVKTVSGCRNISLFITDYLPIKHGRIGKRDINSRLRRLLRMPLKIKCLSDKKWVKKGVLRFGNSICCPSVAYNRRMLGNTVFTSQYKYDLDWDTFYKYACRKGRFAYVDLPLTFYRVHDGATSKEFIEDNRRVLDDTSMFEKFWPKWFAKILMIFYKMAYKTYD